MNEKEMTAPYLLAQIRSSHPKYVLNKVYPKIVKISRPMSKI